MVCGVAAGGKLCEYRMELEKQWENPEPQTKIINGKEAITTKSVLICKAGGTEIQAATSGQEFGKKLAEQINLKVEMDAEYPGLYNLLMDPYGSLYLNEGMYETALTFLAELFERYHGCGSDIVAIQVNEQIYVRNSSVFLLSDVVHEGTHALDYYNGISQKVISSWTGETAAYSAERLFRLKSGGTVEFATEEDIMVHIW